jgi:hypothetical protein
MTESPTAVTCPAARPPAGATSAGNVVGGAVPVAGGAVVVAGVVVLGAYGAGAVVSGGGAIGGGSAVVLVATGAVVVGEDFGVVRSGGGAFTATVAGEPQAASSISGKVALTTANCAMWRLTMLDCYQLGRPEKPNYGRRHDRVSYSASSACYLRPTEADTSCINGEATATVSLRTDSLPRDVGVTPREKLGRRSLL